MPQYDGTGPWGLGSGTGWGMGPCGAGMGFRRGWRRAFAWRGGRFFQPKITKKEEKKLLEEELKYLEEEIKEVKSRLADLKG